MSFNTLSIAGPANFESASSNTPLSNTLPSNFYSVMRREYLDTRGLLSLGRKRRSKGLVLYIYIFIIYTITRVIVIAIRLRFTFKIVIR